MAEKKVGEKKSCFTCHKEMVCVLVKGAKKDDGSFWDDRLVWQTDGKAHYGFNKSLKKPFCNYSTEAQEHAGEIAGSKVSSPDKTHIEHIDLPIDTVGVITAESIDLANRMIVVLSAVETVCEAAGITHPAKIGMIYNQVCQTRRG